MTPTNSVKTFLEGFWWIEPHLTSFVIEEYWHPVMDLRYMGIRFKSQTNEVVVLEGCFFRVLVYVRTSTKGIIVEACNFEVWRNIVRLVQARPLFRLFFLFFLWKLSTLGRLGGSIRGRQEEKGLLTLLAVDFPLVVTIEGQYTSLLLEQTTEERLVDEFL